MTSSSALRSLNQRQVMVPPRPVDWPAPLRWREAVTLQAAVGHALLEPDFGEGFSGWGEDSALERAQGTVFLAAKTLLGLQPAYAVALVDQDGRLCFKETLRFTFPPTPAQPDPQAWPDPRTAWRLERLGALLADRPVYVPDELAGDLDGLRQHLAQASRVRSLCALLARRARPAGDGAIEALLAKVGREFDDVEDPAARARFVLRASRWTPPRVKPPVTS